MKKLNKVLSTVFTFAFAATLGIAAAHAAPVEVIDTTSFSADIITDTDRPQDAFTSDFRSAVVGIINYILTFLGLAAVAFIVYAGILLVTDAGGEENVGKAKNIILYASVGIVLVLLSYAVVNVVIGVKETVA